MPRSSRVDSILRACFVGIAVLVAGLSTAESVMAAPPPRDAVPVLRAIPADALFAWFGRPLNELAGANREPAGLATAPAQVESQLPIILAFIQAAGLMPDQGQVFADTAAWLPLLGRFEYAVALLDVRAVAVPTTRPATRPTASRGAIEKLASRVESLQLAIVLHSRGRNEDILALLGRMVGRYTNDELATLSTQSVDGIESQRLVDRRLPAWAVWEWGRLDDLYVICIGRGTFASVVATYAGRTQRLDHDDWFNLARRKADCSAALLSLYFDYSRLESRLAPVLGARFTAVLDSIGIRDVRRDFWCLALNHREFGLSRVFENESGAQVRRYSGSPDTTRLHAEAIPSGARRYAVLRMPVRDLIRRVGLAYVASRTPRKAAALRRFWTQLETDAGGDVDGRILDHLGSDMILCDYPPHPLGIPFALTIAVSIDKAADLRTALDHLLRAWARVLNADRGSKLFRITVVQSDDGVWYLQAGLLGPALKVTDRYIVVSWSPQALREALSSFEGRRR